MAKRDPELGFYMVNLWAAAWHNMPAASLDDDDDVLAELAMCDPRRWLKVRDRVLRGWIRCSDGRLYHPVVAEKANQAWAAKKAQQQRTEAARQALLEKRRRELTPVPPAVPSSGSEARPVDITGSAGSVTDSVTVLVAESRGEETIGEKRRRDERAADPQNRISAMQPCTVGAASALTQTNAPGALSGLAGMAKRIRRMRQNTSAARLSNDTLCGVLTQQISRKLGRQLLTEDQDALTYLTNKRVPAKTILDELDSQIARHGIDRLNDTLERRGGLRYLMPAIFERLNLKKLLIEPRSNASTMQ